MVLKEQFLLLGRQGEQELGKGERRSKSAPQNKENGLGVLHRVDGTGDVVMLTPTPTSLPKHREKRQTSWEICFPVVFSNIRLFPHLG